MLSRRYSENGVAMVEFVLVLPILIVLVFAVIEFGYFFTQQNAVRSAAREGARIAATHPEWSTSQIETIVCDIFDLDPSAYVEASERDGGGGVAPGESYQGGVGTFLVNASFQPLTGFFPFLSTSTPIESEIDFLVEVTRDPDTLAPVWWNDGGGSGSC